MKLLLFFLGLALVSAAIFILRPIVRNLPQFGFLDFLISGFALSLLTGGVKMLWAAFFVP
ncbi:hypothetical protein H6F44_20060 [Pseudanabaena sp. FACHB-1277]|uniref:Uncharacterized protein n=1 Tax=Pseudanabaena cinerea FACHB-1277 TaxID=2949581 RepID=A0A926UWY9_9CYAN|nr:hypothetical protein [Pseudanabaena cinerea]MBD2152393.1 hypothetical protein [Pseudanabaena cinerea FACHB-1277]